jgi:poly-gamma-glutamate synthesis protein (capsule biosynthesis protein)
LPAGCSGTPENWAATDNKPGLAYLQPVINRKNLRDNFLIVDSAIKKYTRNNDIIFISVHWGPNWGNNNDGSEYRQELAHMLIDQSNVSLIYGHSSHHIRGMEIYKDKLIIYGAGDFINDYESIENPGQEKYNKDGMLVLVTLNINGDFSGLEIQPTYVQNLQVKLVSNKTRINKLIRDINRWSEHDVGNNNYPLILQ